MTISYITVAMIIVISIERRWTRSNKVAKARRLNDKNDGNDAKRAIKTKRKLIDIVMLYWNNKVHTWSDC